MPTIPTAAASGSKIPKRRADGTLMFADWPEFRPNLTPREIFSQGAFGGTYWRPIHSRVTGRDYRNQHKKYSFLARIPEDMMSCVRYDVEKNKYGARSGTSLEYWEDHNWIVARDPYGWVQWYCEFYGGRRSADDERQIARWKAFAGPQGRFRLRLVGMIQRAKTKYNDVKISPVIRQGLHHWAYCITAADIRAAR